MDSPNSSAFTNSHLCLSNGFLSSGHLLPCNGGLDEVTGMIRNIFSVLIQFECVLCLVLPLPSFKWAVIRPRPLLVIPAQRCPAWVTSAWVDIRAHLITHQTNIRSLVEALLRTLQGIVGETYGRLLAGEAAKDPSNALYLPDDYQFHGKVSTATHKLAGCLQYFNINLLPSPALPQTTSCSGIGCAVHVFSCPLDRSSCLGPTESAYYIHRFVLLGQLADCFIVQALSVRYSKSLQVIGLGRESV